MISVKLMACGSHVVRDADANTVSIFNIYEGIGAVGYPLLIQFFAALVLLERNPAEDPAQHEATFNVRLGDQVLAHGDVHVDFGDKRHSRQILRLAGLVVPTPGVLETVFQMGAVSATYTIHLERVNPPQVEAVQAEGL
jgi:hypothetical protein